MFSHNAKSYSFFTKETGKEYLYSTSCQNSSFMRTVNNVVLQLLQSYHKSIDIRKKVAWQFLHFARSENQRLSSKNQALIDQKQNKAIFHSLHFDFRGKKHTSVTYVTDFKWT